MKVIYINGKTRYQAEDGKIFVFMTMCIIWEEIFHGRKLSKEELIEIDAYESGEIDL